jgi:hypothetical protein
LKEPLLQLRDCNTTVFASLGHPGFLLHCHMAHFGTRANSTHTNGVSIAHARHWKVVIPDTITQQFNDQVPIKIPLKNVGYFDVTSQL